eukprot:jgi/Undpi1/12865/HiC_scaffold_7.g02532.m1
MSSYSFVHDIDRNQKGGGGGDGSPHSVADGLGTASSSLAGSAFGGASLTGSAYGGASRADSVFGGGSSSIAGDSAGASDVTWDRCKDGREGPQWINFNGHRIRAGGGLSLPPGSRVVSMERDKSRSNRRPSTDPAQRQRDEEEAKKRMETLLRVSRNSVRTLPSTVFPTYVALVLPWRTNLLGEF